MKMMSLGGDDDDAGVRNLKHDPNADSAPIHTQPLDSQFFPSSLHGDDAFETQILNLGETQVLDDLDWDDCMDTQLIDEFDGQVVMDSDGEGTDRTEVLGDCDELSGDEVGTADKWKSCDESKMQSTYPWKHSEQVSKDQCNSLTDGQNSSGLHISTEAPNDQVCKEKKHGSAPRFTSLRVESLRASARNITLKGIKDKSFSLLPTSQFSEKDTAKDNGAKILEEGDLVAATKECTDDEAERFKGNKCKIGCSTVRRLFPEDSFSENEGLPCKSDNAVGGEVGAELNFDDGLAGLSYIDSQEPGDLAQANALAFVERLIDENKELVELEVDKSKSTGGKGNLLSSAKGPQLLAKKTNDRIAEGKTGIFDWDDGCEDEGGGEIFCRRKDEFLGIDKLGQRSFRKPKKANGNQLDGCGDKEGKTVVQNERVSRSDSKLILGNLLFSNKTKHDADMNTKRNLLNEFDEQGNLETSVVHLEGTVTGKEAAEILDVGLDTQIAAEAMEALFNGEGTENRESNNVHLDLPVNFKGSLKRSPSRRAKKQCSLNNNRNTGVSTRPSNKTKRTTAKSSQISEFAREKHLDNLEMECHADRAMTQKGATKRVREEHATFTPVARRTRKSFVVSQLRSSENSLELVEETTYATETGGLELNREAAIGVQTSNVSNGEDKLIVNNGIRCPRRRRSVRSLYARGSKHHDLSGNIKSVSGHKGSETSTKITEADNKKRKTRSSISAFPDLSCVNQDLGEKSVSVADGPGLGNGAFYCNSTNKKGVKPKALLGAEAVKVSGRKTEAVKLSGRKTDEYSPPPANKVNVSSDASPRGTTKPSELASTSPLNCMTPVNAASPVCMGNGFRQLCKKNLSRSGLMRELSYLRAERPKPIPAMNDSRKRRDLANVRVLFSHHLDEDIIKQQRKIVDRLKASLASSITDATHFITDKFVRTRNMLEAIASGKPVVTHLWLENVGEANYYIDEEKYILRDLKKEKELGFNMPVSLAHAREHPLLRGRRVFITPNSKPGKEIISSLVKAVHGQAVERVGRYGTGDNMVPDDLLILSCEEDYDICLPFLEKGVAVYESELLLNGIITQKLDYERHRLFVDHVRRTRSTIFYQTKKKKLALQSG